MADFGTALDMVNGLPLRWSFASGRRNLANALARRLITPQGSLSYAPDAGIDVRQSVNASLSRSGVAELSAAVARELEKDDRVLAATCAATFTAGKLTLGIEVTTADGPFSFVVVATALTVSILGDL